MCVQNKLKKKVNSVDSEAKSRSVTFRPSIYSCV